VPQDETVLLDGPALAEALGEDSALIRQWARRYPDLLPRRGRDDRGRTLFSLADGYRTQATVRRAGDRQAMR
jgi:hypothetical protein